MLKLRNGSAAALVFALAMAAAVLFPTFANAIGFDKFDRYNSIAQAEYLANMVQTAKLAFRNQGRPT
jgi:hypothetical protein